MFLTVKYKVLLALLTVAVIIAGVATVESIKEKQTLGYGKVVVIDAGHGGEDGGVVGSTTGVKESEVNLAIAKRLKTLLEEGGYRAVMTRSNDSGLYGAISSNKKRADMQKRKEIILDAKPDFVVSIHQNYYPSSYVSGAQVFYPPSGAFSEEANVMQKVLNRSLSCSRTEAKGDYYIIQCSPYPSLLIECGFMSNPTDEHNLVSAEYQAKVAYAVYSGINFILGSPLPA